MKTLTDKPLKDKQYHTGYLPNQVFFIEQVDFENQAADQVNKL